MAGKMLLVNPRKRRARRKTTARKKTAARRAPARRKTAARRSPARRTASRVRRRTAAPARRRRRSNPARRGIMGKYLRPAMMGGATATGIDVAMGYVPLPDMLSTGMARHAAKGAVAIGFGMFASKSGLIKAATAEEMARGALTVYTADIIREGVQTYLPNVSLGYYSPAYVPPDGVSEYLSGGSPGNALGYESGPSYATGLSEYMDPAAEYDTSYIG